MSSSNGTSVGILDIYNKMCLEINTETHKCECVLSKLPNHLQIHTCDIVGNPFNMPILKLDRKQQICKFMYLRKQVFYTLLAFASFFETIF